MNVWEKVRDLPHMALPAYLLRLDLFISKYRIGWPHMPRLSHQACLWLDSFLGLGQSDKGVCDCLTLHGKALSPLPPPATPFPPSPHLRLPRLLAHVRLLPPSSFFFWFYKVAFIYNDGLFTDLIHTHFDFYESHLAHISQATKCQRLKKEACTAMAVGRAGGEAGPISDNVPQPVISLTVNHSKPALSALSSPLRNTFQVAGSTVSSCLGAPCFVYFYSFFF